MTREEAIKNLNSLKIHFNDDSEIHNAYDMAIKALEQENILDKIKAEITDCLKALDEIEKFGKSGFNLYSPDEISGRRLTYHQCLDIINKYKAESEE